MSLELVRSFGPWMVIPLERPPSRRRFGVPIGGPFDRESFEVACFLVDANEAFELALGTFTFLAFEDCSIGLAGSVGRVTLDDCSSTNSGVIPLRRGQQIEVAIGGGARAYLSWSPGLRSPLALDQPQSNGSTLRYIPRPSISLDLGQAMWEVSPISDRTGTRLSGIEDAHEIELPSEPVCIGAIQWTPDGTLIIIGPDGPTIGGYPLVGTVISADLDRVGQLVSGARVTIEAVDLASARSLLGTYDQGLKNRRAILNLARNST